MMGRGLDLVRPRTTPARTLWCVASEGVPGPGTYRGTVVQAYDLPAVLPTAADECVRPDGSPRAPYERLFATLTNGDHAGLAGVQQDAIAWFAERGITFGAPSEGPAPIFPFDPVPRVIGAEEWAQLERGLAQRAVALDHFVADCYGAQRALRNGVVPASLVYSSTGYLRDVVGAAPPRSTWCHVSGIDVVRIDGRFAVLEDNVRVPSGIAYALMSRRAMHDLKPEWLDGAGVRSISDYPRRLLDILQRIAPRPWQADIAVLTPGPFNAAYYEHGLLAQGLGAALVEGRNLWVHDDQVYRRDSDGSFVHVDVVYSRVNSEWIDPLVFRSDSVLGSPGIIEAWRRGNVALANAPGTGVADDKAIYPYVPEMVRYYLGEEPLLDNVPTFDLTDSAQRLHVLANLDRIVFKPVDASGGYGIHFGRLMSRDERSEMAARVIADPRAWLAQEEVTLSRAVCLGAEGGFEARCVDLRPFVLLDEQPWIVPGGLTRVAGSPDMLVVNSSQGGGSKDTWVLKS
jgi:uncharacterized circularly permuted ATP-grasp superfamily protein